MTSTQKVIKYCSLALAIFLIISIISGIAGAVVGISELFDKSNHVSEDFSDLDINSDSKILDIDLKSSSLTIKVGEVLKAETNNKNINVKQDNNRIYIKEKKNSWFTNGGELVIYVPRDLIFDLVNIDTGAGKIEIDALITNRLDFDLGAGRVNVNYLGVFQKGKISTGAGAFTINNGNMNNIDFDLGVGKIDITGSLLGSTKIDSGVGSTNVNIIGSKDDYKIDVDKGLGSINVDGESLKDSTSYGNGVNTIDIDGGVGSITINFNNETGDIF